MRYYVISQDGQRYGPADIATLNQWAAEGRLLAHQMLEEESSGIRQVASSVAGINFGGQQQQTYAAPGQGQAYQQYPRSSFAGDDGSGDIRQAWIFGVLGLCCCGLIFGILGLNAANRAAEKGHPQAQAAKILCIIDLVLWAAWLILRMVSSGSRGFDPTSFGR